MWKRTPHRRADTIRPYIVYRKTSVGVDAHIDPFVVFGKTFVGADALDGPCVVF